MLLKLMLLVSPRRMKEQKEKNRCKSIVLFLKSQASLLLLRNLFTLNLLPRSAVFEETTTFSNMFKSLFVTV